LRHAELRHPELRHPELPPLEQVVATPGTEVQSVKTIGVLGVLGGMSGVASGEYYRLCNERVNARLGGHAAAGRFPTASISR